MSHKEVEIHGFKVKYDDNSGTLSRAAEYLSKKLEKSEAKVFFDDARKDTTNHTAHWDFHDHHRSRNQDLTIVHKDDGSYHLRKRGR